MGFRHLLNVFLTPRRPVLRHETQGNPFGLPVKLLGVLTLPNPLSGCKMKALIVAWNTTYKNGGKMKDEKWQFFSIPAIASIAVVNFDTGLLLCYLILILQ